MSAKNDKQTIVTDITLASELKGSILDVGGGGEGIVGRLYQDQVTAIDNNKEELDEASVGYTKRFMDATHLEFEDETYQHITFFSLMYMTW